MENQKKQPLRTQHLIVLSIIFVSLASFLLLDETFPERFSNARFLAKLSDEGPGLSPLLDQKTIVVKSKVERKYIQYFVCTSEANRVPIPRKSPSPSPKFGDRVGAGKVFLDSAGKIWGLGELNSWGFLGINSPKIPKI